METDQRSLERTLAEAERRCALSPRFAAKYRELLMDFANDRGICRMLGVRDYARLPPDDMAKLKAYAYKQADATTYHY